MKLKEETWKSHFLAFRRSLYRRILCNTGLTCHTRSSALHEKMRVSSGYGEIKWFHMSPRTSLTAEALNQTASPHTQNVPEEHETAWVPSLMQMRWLALLRWVWRRPWIDEGAGRQNRWVERDSCFSQLFHSALDTVPEVPNQKTDPETRGGGTNRTFSEPRMYFSKASLLGWDKDQRRWYFGRIKGPPQVPELVLNWMLRQTGSSKIRSWPINTDQKTGELTPI